MLGQGERGGGGPAARAARGQRRPSSLYRFTRQSASDGLASLPDTPLATGQIRNGRLGLRIRPAGLLPNAPLLGPTSLAHLSPKALIRPLAFNEFSYPLGIMYFPQSEVICPSCLTGCGFLTLKLTVCHASCYRLWRPPKPIAGRIYYRQFIRQMTDVAFHDSPIAMEPLIPESKRHELAKLTVAIHREAGRLQGALHPLLRPHVAEVVREMNSYYSNLIEGQPTYPKDMEAARAHTPAPDDAARKRQQLGLAHLETEEWMREELAANPSRNVFSKDFICSLHREFYERLSVSERVIRSKSKIGEPTRPLIVGDLRASEVTVGQHVPPASTALPVFMQRFEAFYGGREIIATRRVIAAAAAHHRLAWIHPFGDGNGRVTRLFTHAALIRTEIDANGLWTISRGLARKRQQYYDLLATADQPRQGSLDGRGNLSDRGLAEFCQFFLETALDQVKFMTALLDLETLEGRIAAYAKEQKVFEPTHAERGFRLLRELLRCGEMDRPSLAAVVDRGAVTTRKMLQAAERAGLIEAANIKAPYRLKFSADLYESYFPKLFLASL
jgi:Fic family protein